MRQGPFHVERPSVPPDLAGLAALEARGVRVRIGDPRAGRPFHVERPAPT